MPPGFHTIIHQPLKYLMIQWRELNNPPFKKLMLTVVGLCGTLTTAFAAPGFLALADIHLDAKAQQINYGQDTGQPLWLRAQHKIQHLVAKEKPTFIVILGDLPAHTFLNSHRANNIKIVLHDLHKILGNRSTPVYLVPGNNDSLTGDYHSFSDKKAHSLLQFDSSWPALNSQTACSATRGYTPCLINAGNHVRFSYYSAYPLGSKKHLQLIVLNSVIFSGRQYVSDDGLSQLDAAKIELHWLADALKTAEANHDAVIIAMHIPPGEDAHKKTMMWKGLMFDKQTVLNHFIQLISRYRKTIRLILTAHTHMDEVRKIYNDKGHFSALSISVASISPIHKNNPSLKFVSYNPLTFSIRDIKTWYSTPTAKTWGDKNYSFKANYHCRGIGIKACVKSMPAAILYKNMHRTYWVKSPTSTEDWRAIDSATHVAPHCRPADKPQDDSAGASERRQGVRKNRNN